MPVTAPNFSSMPIEAIQEVGKAFFLDGEDREELNLALALLAKNP
jgi:hypothetical protein